MMRGKLSFLKRESGAREQIEQLLGSDREASMQKKRFFEIYRNDRIFFYRGSLHTRKPRGTWRASLDLESPF